MSLTTSETGTPVPQQARSRKSMDNVLSSATKLMNERPFHQIPINDFARAAKVSIGSFYNRFPSKDSLLLHLGQKTLLDEIVPVIRTKLNAADWKHHSLEDRVDAYFQLSARLLENHRAVLKPLSEHLDRQNQDPLRHTATAFNDIAHAIFKELIHAGTGKPDRQCSKQTIDDAMLWASAAIRHIVLYRSKRAKSDVTRLVRSISTAVAMLLVHPPSKNSRS